MPTPLFTRTIIRLWELPRALGSCRVPWRVVVRLVKNWATWVSFTRGIILRLIFSQFWRVLSLKSHPKIDLNCFCGDEWPLNRSENEAPDVYLFNLCSLVLAPNHWYLGVFHWKIPKYLSILDFRALFNTNKNCAPSEQILRVWRAVCRALELKTFGNTGQCTS